MKNIRHVRKRNNNTNRTVIIAGIAVITAGIILMLVFGLSGRGGKKPSVKDGKLFFGDAAETDSAENDGPPPQTREGAIYYNSLTYDEQQMYDAVLAAAQNVSEKSDTVDCSLSVERFEDIVTFVRAENPELFYVDFDALVLEDNTEQCYADMKYCVDTAAIPDMTSELEEAVRTVTTGDGFLLCGSDLEKEIFLHDMLIDSCSGAQQENPLFNTAYGALVLKEAYCDGYAYAMKLLLRKAGIQAFTVYGRADDADHAWNIVCIDGKYYHLDAMWDDANLPIDMRFHGYFNLSDSAISRDHTVNYTELLPRAEEGGDYYTLTGKSAETLSELTDVFSREIEQAAGEGRKYIEVLCAETNSNDELGKYLVPCITAYNSAHENTFLDIFHVFPASAVSNAVTIQLFYAE